MKFHDRASFTGREFWGVVYKEANGNALAFIVSFPEGSVARLSLYLTSGCESDGWVG